MKFRLPGSKPEDEYLKKSRESTKFAMEMSDRNTEWYEKTGRPVQERPGFQEEFARLKEMNDEGTAILQAQKAERQKINDKAKAEIEKLTKEGEILERESGYSAWKEKKGLR